MKNMIESAILRYIFLFCVVYITSLVFSKAKAPKDQTPTCLPTPKVECVKNKKGEVLYCPLNRPPKKEKK